MKNVETRLDELEVKLDTLISLLEKNKIIESDKPPTKVYPTIGSEIYWAWVHNDRKYNLSDDYENSNYNYFDEDYFKTDPITHCLVWFNFDKVLEVCDKMNYRYGFNENKITLETLEKNALECLTKVYDSFCNNPNKHLYTYQLGRIHAYAIDYGFDENTHEDAFIVTDKNENKHELVLKLSFEIEDSTTLPY